MNKISGLSTNHCTAVIFFYRPSETAPYHTAISGIVSKSVGDVKYYAHTVPKDGNNTNEDGIRFFLEAVANRKVEVCVLK